MGAHSRLIPDSRLHRERLDTVRRTVSLAPPAGRQWLVACRRAKYKNLVLAYHICVCYPGRGALGLIERRADVQRVAGPCVVVMGSIPAWGSAWWLRQLAHVGHDVGRGENVLDYTSWPGPPAVDRPRSSRTRQEFGTDSPGDSPSVAVAWTRGA